MDDRGPALVVAAPRPAAVHLPITLFDMCNDLTSPIPGTKASWQVLFASAFR